MNKPAIGRTIMVVPGFSFHTKATKTMSTTTTRPIRKIVVSFVSRANELKLRDWLLKNYGGYGHDSLRNGAFRRQVAAKASRELGFKVTERNLQSRYYKMRGKTKTAAPAVADKVATPASTAHVPITLGIDNITALKQVANEQHARITSLENQVRRLFAIARKYVPSEDISAPQTDLTTPFAGV